MTIYEDASYLDTNPDWHEEDGAWKANEVLTMLGRNKLHLKKMADVGCGTGRVIADVAKQLDDNIEFTGFDIASAPVEIGREAHSPKVKFRVGDFTEINTEVFDLVLLMDVFEHVPDYLGFLERLRPHGEHFMFHIPLDMNALHVLMDHQTKSRAMAGHLHYFSKSSALLTLEGAGYDVVDWFYTPVYQTAKARRSLVKRLIEAPRWLGSKIAPDFAVRVLGGCSVMALARPKK